MSTVERKFNLVAPAPALDAMVTDEGLSAAFPQSPLAQPEAAPAMAEVASETGFVVHDGVMVTAALAEVIARDPASPRAITGLEAAKRRALETRREHWVKHGVWPTVESATPDEPNDRAYDLATPLERIAMLNARRRAAQEANTQQ